MLKLLTKLHSLIINPPSNSFDWYKYQIKILEENIKDLERKCGYLDRHNKLLRQKINKLEKQVENK